MPRFYIANFTGDGLTPETAWFPRILGLQSSPALFTLDGRAIANVNGPCLVYTDNTDAEHLAVKADPDIKYIHFENTNGDVLGLMDTVADIDQTKKSSMISFLESKHIPTHGITNQSTIREAVGVIAKRFILRGNLRGVDLVEGLDTNIADIPQAQRQAIATQLQSKGFDTSGLSGTVRQALTSLMNQDIGAMRFNL
jgi:hypothetical protein